MVTPTNLSISFTKGLASRYYIDSTCRLVSFYNAIPIASTRTLEENSLDYVVPAGKKLLFIGWYCYNTGGPLGSQKFWESNAADSATGNNFGFINVGETDSAGTTVLWSGVPPYTFAAGKYVNVQNPGGTVSYFYGLGIEYTP